MIWVLIGAAGMAMVLSLVLTWIVRQFARSRGWMAGPISRRHVHTVPIPRLGGVAVYLSIATALAGASHSGQRVERGIQFVLVPIGWMFATGLMDDLWGVAAARKLLAQVVGAIGIFYLGFRIPSPDFLGITGLSAEVLSFLLTVAWSVAVINAINLIDGLDGLASGSSLCVVFALLVLGLLTGQAGVALLAAATIGGVAGFIWFNAYPASIFLGDSGSLVLGSTIAAITIRLMSEFPTGWLVCLMILAHPFAELVISSTRRYLRADPIFRPDRRHLHHRLLDRGLSHPQASEVLVMVSFLACLLGLLAALGGYLAVVAVVGGVSVTVLAIVELQYSEFSHFGRLLRKMPRQRSLIAAHMNLEELRGTVSKARSMAELRLALSEGFTAMGFESARLRVRSYDAAGIPAGSPTSSVAMSFGLSSGDANLGILELSWDVRTGCWPFDPEYFTTDFLPVLCRKLQAFVQLYRELPRSAVPRSSAETELFPSLAAESGASVRMPLNF